MPGRAQCSTRHVQRLVFCCWEIRATTHGASWAWGTVINMNPFHHHLHPVMSVPSPPYQIGKPRQNKVE